MRRAKCRNEPTNIDFSEEDDVDEAKEFCLGCPVILECLKSALDSNERWGVWGGLTPSERRTIRHGRKMEDVLDRHARGWREGVEAGV